MTPVFNAQVDPAFKISRRTMCGATAAALAGLALPGRLQAAADSGWIDAHVHVWTPDLAKYPLSGGFARSDMQPPSFTPSELFEHTKKEGVTRIVLIQMSYYQYDNSYMLDVIAQNPGVFSGVAIVDHEANDLVARVKSLADRGVRGFRIHARGEDAASWKDSAGMGLLWRTAAAEGLAICPLINPADLTHVDALSRRFPDTKVVIDHFARVGISGRIEAEQLDALCKLAELPNTYVKTSAFYALGKKEAPYHDLQPMVRRVLDAFGPERLMWASDCPFQVQANHNYHDSIALIRDAASELLSEADKHWLLRDTAQKVFF